MRDQKSQIIGAQDAVEVFAGYSTTSATRRARVFHVMIGPSLVDMVRLLE